MTVEPPIGVIEPPQGGDRPMPLTGRLVYVRHPDGATLDLNDGVNIKLRHHDGFGVPEFQHAVSPSPGIDGDYWFGVRYPPRIVTVDVVLMAQGLGALQDLRRQVISILNPTIRSGTLQMVQANGVARWFDCVLAESLPMPTTQHLAQHAMMLTLRFRSVGEPFLYDPADQTYTVSASVAPGAGTFMLGGFAFPFKLAQSGVFNEIVMTYLGDVPTPVEITLYGPGQEPVFRNDTVGRFVGFEGSGLTLLGGGLGVPFSGEQLVVDMDPRKRDVIYRNGNGWPYLRESGFWWLQPGPNSLSFQVTGSSPETRLVMKYRPRYLGV